MIVVLALLTLAQAPAPTPPPAPTGPVVVIKTSLGSIKVVLDGEHAPLSVKNFLDYMRSGSYDGTIFHRVMPGFMIQGGGLDPDMKERPTRAPIRSEARNGLRNVRGALALARTSNPNSATAQFFINLRNNHSLDFGIGGYGYAVFGRVLEGMDVVDEIAKIRTTARGPHANVPVTPVVIESVREIKPVSAPPAPVTP